MTDITLTQAQREAVKNDMDNQIEMLTDEEVEILASKLNDKIDIPFIKEGTEQTIFVKTVKKADRLLYQSLPNEIYGLVKNISDGISDSDAEELVSVLGTRLNNKFDIPYVPEWIEQKIFETLIGLIVSAMRKNYSILELPA
ncbi:hypothetical protein [Dasania marina]|uniref:hypothetical protein n=1 Tax=Dasania marina TaxID=471499 RepID=UPI0012E9B81D|nr:hypothetical protein [Dasania marina]